MGAEVIIRPPTFSRSRFGGIRPRSSTASSGFEGLNVDVRAGRFVIEAPATMQLQVMHEDPADRHLLLMARHPTLGQNQKFLCGHDERDWFVASVPRNTTTVREAKDRLMPALVRASVYRHALPSRKRHKRNNPAFIRQGEWFFVPLREPLEIDPMKVLQREPLVRVGGGKPHWIDEVYRLDGQLMRVHSLHAPDGISPSAFQRLPEATRRRPGWNTMRRNPKVFARGKVRHPDHATIRLDDWHRVAMNAEIRSANLGFLD
jgi:hypothetical protein